MAHESSTHGDRLRIWTLPAVLPAMVGIAAAAHMLEQVADDPTEALGYLVIAEGVAVSRRQSSGAGEPGVQGACFTASLQLLLTA